MYPDRKTSSLFKPVIDLTAKSCSSLTALESLQQHETNPLIPPLRPIADEFVVLLRYAVPIIGKYATSYPHCQERLSYLLRFFA
jgi:hypothetical protein